MPLRKNRIRLFTFFFLAMLVLANCQDSVVLVPLSDDVHVPDEEVEEKEQKVFLVDQTGKEWDITHAVNAYGFDPDRFMFGLGPDAIRPILKPEMICPGQEGYPEDNAGFTVLGTSLNGFARAYNLVVMSKHEVVDEVFGDAHVAVAY